MRWAYNAGGAVTEPEGLQKQVNLCRNGCLAKLLKGMALCHADTGAAL